MISLKDLDFLSPKISLFYYGRRRHSGNFGGILTIIMIIFCFLYVLYLFLEVYLHTSSTIQYYRHYFKDPNIYLFNNTKGIFHFFQIYNPKNNSHLSSFNSKYIRLFMSTIQEEYKNNPEILSETEHWVYDDCREGIDNKLLSKELFKDISLKNGLCIRYYYNKDNKKYYPIEDNHNFKYPNINSSSINMDYSIGTIIEKCNNNSVLTKLFGTCGGDIEIEKYLKDNYGINFNILTNEISPTNYGHQIYNFIYGISNIMKRNKTIENNILICPLEINIKSGILFPMKKQNKTYSFNEHYIMDEERNKNSRILLIYNFCLSQSGYVFKSSYITIYDSFPKVGGIIQLIYYIFFGINYLYNRFTIINDTKKLFFTLHNDEAVNGGSQIKTFSKIVNDLRKIHITSINTKNKNVTNLYLKNKAFSNNLNNSKINNNYYIKSDFNFNKISNSFNDLFFQKYMENDNSKSLTIFPFIFDKDLKLQKSNNFLNISDKNMFMEKSDIILDKRKSKNIKNKILNDDLDNSIIDSKNEKVICEIKKNPNNNKNANNDSDLKKAENMQIQKKSQKPMEKNELNNNNNNKDKDKDILYFQLLLQKFFIYKKKNFIYEQMKVQQVDMFFHFGKYLASLFCYRKPRKYYLVLSKFRKKLLSEEHFFRTHNYLYLFEKCFDIQESEKIDIIELYKNL